MDYLLKGSSQINHIKTPPSFNHLPNEKTTCKVHFTFVGPICKILFTFGDFLAIVELDVICTLHLERLNVK